MGGDSGRDGTGSALVRSEVSGAVTTVVLDSPHNRNALSQRLLSELLESLERAIADEDTRVIVLTGTGSTFCSGADLRERLEPPGAPGASVAGVLTAIAMSPTPVVAQVNGHVRAGGIGLVAACDLAVAGEDATFAFTEVRVGVAPAIIAVAALPVIGRRALAHYALTGEVFGASDAASCGLLTASVPPGGIEGWTDGVVDALLRSAPSAVAATKRLFDVLGGLGWQEAIEVAALVSDQMFAGLDAAEGMAAFLEKRPPSWVRSRA